MSAQPLFIQCSVDFFFFLTVGAVMLKWKKDEKFLNVKQFSLLLCEEKKHFYFKISNR